MTSKRHVYVPFQLANNGMRFGAIKTDIKRQYRFFYLKVVRKRTVETYINTVSVSIQANWKSRRQNRFHYFKVKRLRTVETYKIALSVSMPAKRKKNAHSLCVHSKWYFFVTWKRVAFVHPFQYHPNGSKTVDVIILNMFISKYVYINSWKS